MIVNESDVLVVGGTLGSLVIFNDPHYVQLALVGAVVSLLGVLHTLVNDNNKLSVADIIMELIRAIVIGFVAIPIWYLLLSGVGNQLITKELGVNVEFSGSVWLMLAFILSWYTSSILMVISRKIHRWYTT